MRILVVPDRFAGMLSAAQAADAVTAGWSRGAPHDEVTALPLADGGPGFVDIVHAGVGGELIPVTVRDPLGRPTPAMILVAAGGSGPVAYLESAHAAGLHLVPGDRRDPTVTTTVGVGELLRAALDLGVRRIVVGLGGSATNDGGAGLLAGLGLADPLLRSGGGGLGSIAPEHLDGLSALRRDLAGVDLVVATDVDAPLLGLHGASAAFAGAKGATPEQAQDLERGMGHYADVVAQVTASDGVRADLLAAGGRGEPAGVGRPGQSRSRVLAQIPGAGAGGGLGFALAVLGGRVLPGADVVADAVGLDRYVQAADIVVTGERMFDGDSLHGKVIAAVAQHGLRHGVPVVVVCAQMVIGRREWSAAGVAGAYAVAENHAQLVDALADPAGTLAARAERVARTWSR